MRTGAEMCLYNCSWISFHFFWGCVSFVLQMEPQIKFLPGRRSVCSGEDSSTNGARLRAARSRHIPEGRFSSLQKRAMCSLGRMGSLMKECQGIEKWLKNGDLSSNSSVLGGGQEIPQLWDSQGNDRGLEIPDECLQQGWVHQYLSWRQRNWNSLQRCSQETHQVNSTCKRDDFLHIP